MNIAAIKTFAIAVVRYYHDIQWRHHYCFITFSVWCVYRAQFITVTQWLAFINNLFPILFVEWKRDYNKWRHAEQLDKE